MIHRFSIMVLICTTLFLVGCGGDAAPVKATKEMEDMQNKAQVQADNEEKAMQKEVKASMKKK